MTEADDKGITGSDRIEKHVELSAPRSRVWHAIANANEFGTWFGVKFAGDFAEGALVTGKITIPGYEHLILEILIDKIQPEQYFSYRWHPYAVDCATDYSSEPMTLVEFQLAASPGGTSLTIVESGFDQIPLARRAEAFKMNDGGWAAQAQAIELHVAQP